jgi:protein ImuB
MAQRIVYLYFPFWDIQRIRRKRRPGLSATACQQAMLPPMVLIHHRQRQEIVFRCCRQCWNLGLRPGAPLVQAQAVLPTTPSPQILPFDPAASRQSITNLARWMMRFSPQVSVDEHTSATHPEPTPDGLILNISGAAHLFGGEIFLLQRLRHLLDQKGLQVKLAAAPTIGAAWALARFAPPPVILAAPTDLAKLLQPLPPAALRIAPATQNFLDEVGITTVGDLLNLPPHSLALHAGTQVLYRLHQALGMQAELFAPLRSGQALTVQCRGDGPMIDLPPILAATRTLAAQLATALQMRGQSVTACQLDFAGPDLAPCSTFITLAQPCQQASHLWTLLRPKIEALRLTGGVETMTLMAVDFVSAPQQQLPTDPAADDMFSRENLTRLGRTLDILRTRLPEHAIRRIAPLESHVPEQSVVYPPFLPSWRAHRNIAAPDSAKSFAWLQPYRPSVLLAHPEPIHATVSAPDQAPSHLQWRHLEYRCVRGLGPERLDTEWWRSDPPETRDYFIVDTHHGQWLWIFHELQSDRWFVHGLWV